MDRSDRVLMGISLGGMAALRYAFSDPEMFGAVATHSAAVFPENPDELGEQHVRTLNRFGDRAGWFELLGNPIDKAKYEALNPLCLARKLKDAKGLRIYFDAGTQDRYGFGPANEKLSAVLKENGIEHTFHLIEGGEHSWGGGTVQKALLESLQFVSAGFSKAKPSGETKPAPAEPAAPKKPAGGQ
jgi:enterochelin esterase-like enzyme